MTSTETWFGSRAVTVESTVLDGGNQALVVAPTVADRAPPGVLWLHWLGHHRNDCTQFLPEATALASRGVVSVLPQGSFPWSRRPTASMADVAELEAELERVRGALAHLRSRTDPDRVAIVGHDYGAMYALALRDPDVRLVVAATPDSSWPHWFLTYWPRVGEVPEGYHEQLERFDPLSSASSLGDRLLLQWAEDDEFVPGHAPGLYAQAAPAAKALSYPYDHQLGDAAAADRLSALKDAFALD